MLECVSRAKISGAPKTADHRLTLRPRKGRRTACGLRIRFLARAYDARPRLSARVRG